ncbi:MAG: methyltransferase, partial [Gammaproteobacteria bacterium]|nr:methyltransferase [Gammaproteobacteria bacterium]
SMTLDAVLASQPDEIKARYKYRNPEATLKFFGIKPGMTVVEGLPGGGWYSKILIPYLGPQGHLVGVDYAQSMYPKFGFFSDEFIKAKETWVEDWTGGARDWYGATGAEVSAFTFGELPPEWLGKADAALMIRAMHNLARFESDGGYLSQALADLYASLKPGGILGVVQHQAPDGNSDEWASGSKGYVKKDFLIAQVEAAGFELVAESGINHNHRDQPTEEDLVWRLPPTLITSGDNPAMAEEMKAIGESHRMTLKFRKPE